MARGPKLVNKEKFPLRRIFDHSVADRRELVRSNADRGFHGLRGWEGMGLAGLAAYFRIPNNSVANGRE